MKVSEIGEFGLINALSAMIKRSRDPTARSTREIFLDIGDDAMVWKPDNPLQIATVDSLVQNVHFSFDSMTWRQLGWKSIAVNISDVAAMGGAPLYALVNLGLPDSARVEDVKALYRGMLDIAARYGVAITGGDTVGSPFVFVSVTVFGCAGNPQGDLMTRSAAKPGDLIAVTGRLGASAAGLQMLLHKRQFPSRTTAALRKAHLTPTPRVTEGQALVACGVRSGMDISDGLIGDLAHICEMSKVGARLDVDSVPVARAAISAFGKEDARLMALTGGEDYELLFTAPRPVTEMAASSVDCPVTVIGEITDRYPGTVRLFNAAGKRVTLPQTGWDHFRPAVEE